MPGVKVNRESFLSKLQAVSPGLAPRELIEQSTCFIFTKGVVSTFNEEIFCRCDTGVKSLNGAVIAEPLLRTLEKMTEDEISLDVGKEELIILGSRRKAGVRMEAEIALDTSSIEQPKDYDDLSPGFAEALNVVASCASDRDDRRFSLTCVHLTPKWLESCDGMQLIRYRMKVPVKESCLLRKKASAAVSSLGMTQMAETDSWLHFRNGGLVMSCRRHVQDFPKLTDFLKVEGEPAVLPGGLQEIVSRAEIFSKQTADRVNKLRVEIRPGKMRIKGVGVIGWFEEITSFNYKGVAMQFSISPEMLVEITGKSAQCEIAPERLKIEGDRYRYVSCLSKIKDKPETGTEESSEEVEEAEVE